MHMDEIRRIASRIIPHRSRSRSLSRRERRASDATTLEEVVAVPNSTNIHDRTTTDSPSPLSPPSGAVTVRTFLAETSKECWLGDYCFQDVLGTDGTHVGRVHLGKRREAPYYSMVKVLSKEKVVHLKQLDHTRTQARIAKNAKHPFIVAYFDLFQDASNLYLAMELVPGGTLQALLSRCASFPEPVAKFYPAESALGLRYLHSLGIVYSDLKPENILLARDGHIKLTSFSCIHAHASAVWTSFCHGHYYIPPELLHLRSYNTPVDWYSLGVLLYEMTTGAPPYHTSDKVQRAAVLCDKIAKGPTCLDWSTFGSAAKDITFRFLEPNPYRRFGHQEPSDIFNHPFFDEVDWVEVEKKRICPPFLPVLDDDEDTSSYDRIPSLDSAAQDYGSAVHDPYGKLFAQYRYLDLSSRTSRA